MDHNHEDVDNAKKPTLKRKINDTGSSASDESVSYVPKAKIVKTSDDNAPEEDFIECGCCFEDVLFINCVTCNEGDLFCPTCVKKYSETRIGEGLIDFPCIDGCGSEFSFNLLEKLLDPRLYGKMLKQRQIFEVKEANIEGLEDCPFCEFAAIPHPDSELFTCLDPDCGKSSCRKCHKQSHQPLRCEEVESDAQTKARTYVEDEMTKALVRECYRCKKPFVKTEGCNKMKCGCGATMCYVCREPVADNYTHFNGEGGDAVHKCPLFSTDRSLHEDAVATRGREAVARVEVPLLHDPTKTLPVTQTKGLEIRPRDNGAE